MGVARIQIGRRAIEAVAGRNAIHRLAFGACLLVFMGAATPAYDDPLALRPDAVESAENGEAASASEVVETWAGFGGVPISEMLSRRLELPGVGGVIVTFVHPEGPAAKAELLPKDIILGANDDAIADGAAWSKWVAEQAPGTKVELTVRRQDQTLRLTLTIEELPSNLESGGN